jgi:uncharacterized protein (DUF1330 family)
MGEPFMTVYVVGQLKFTDRAAYERYAARFRGVLKQFGGRLLAATDRAAYERYAARFRGVLKQFGGRLLAADEQPEIIEGRWDRDKAEA